MSNAVTKALPMDVQPYDARATALGLVRRLAPALLAVGVLLPVGLGLNYVLNVLLARALPTADYGVFAFSVSLAGVLSLGAGLGFSQSMMRLVAAYRVNADNGMLAGLLQSSLRLVCLSSLVVATVLITLAWAFSEQGLSEGARWTALMLPILTIDLWRESTMRGLHRTVDAIVPRQILLPLAVIAAVLLFELDDLFLVVTLYLVTFAALEAVAMVRLRRTLAPLALPNPAFATGHWLKISSPMGLSALAYHGMRSWDIVVVGALVGMEASGLYAAAARTALLASLVLRAVNLVVGPVLAELYHAGHYRRFKSLFGLSVLGASALGIPLYVLVLVYAPEIMSVFGDEYANAALLLRILATGELVNLITGPVGLALTMSRHERVNMVIVVLAAVLSLGSLIVVVPVYGLLGAAIATASVTILLNITQCSYAVYFMSRLTEVNTQENEIVRRDPYGLSS